MKLPAHAPAPDEDDRLIRVGAFWDMHEAEAAVQHLLDAGFDRKHITVVAADEMKKEHLKDFEHEQPAGTKTARAAATGTVVGAIAAGLVGLVGVVTSGPVALLLEPLWVGTGAAVGTFVGAMMSRGVEPEVANYYDQALRRGQVLVAAEIDPDGDRQMLRRAEHIFEELRKQPVPLPKG